VVGWRDHETAMQVLRDDRATWLREVAGTDGSVRDGAGATGTAAGASPREGADGPL